MTLADIPLPEPKSGEVRIRNHAAALNFFDVLQIQGKYQTKPPLPFTPGAEVAGIVDALGPDVEHLAMVIACGFGCLRGFAEYTITPARNFSHARALWMRDRDGWLIDQQFAGASQIPCRGMRKVFAAGVIVYSAKGPLRHPTHHAITNGKMFYVGPRASTMPGNLGPRRKWQRWFRLILP